MGQTVYVLRPLQLRNRFAQPARSAYDHFAMKLSDIEDADQLVTREYLDMKLKAELSELRAEFHKEFSALARTFWQIQLSAIAVTLVGVGIIVHWK